jgi:hypothetical protein
VRWTPYTLQYEVALIKAVADKMCGDYKTAGSFDGAWRDVNWAAVRVKRGDCVGLGAVGVRRSRRIKKNEDDKKAKLLAAGAIGG